MEVQTKLLFKKYLFVDEPSFFLNLQKNAQNLAFFDIQYTTKYLPHYTTNFMYSILSLMDSRSINTSASLDQTNFSSSSIELLMDQFLENRSINPTLSLHQNDLFVQFCVLFFSPVFVFFNHKNKYSSLIANNQWKEVFVNNLSTELVQPMCDEFGEDNTPFDSALCLLEFGKQSLHTASLAFFNEVFKCLLTTNGYYIPFFFRQDRFFKTFSTFLIVRLFVELKKIFAAILLQCIFFGETGLTSTCYFYNTKYHLQIVVL